tara:strand:- start:1081 stop:2337 length:1257 start_codon:yes stop_codon:yes gene_type:complete
VTKRFIIIIIFWLLTLLLTAIWTFENPEKIEKIKSFFKKKQEVNVETVESGVQKFLANSFTVEAKEILKLNDKTAFVIYNEFNDVFDRKKIEIYTQSGTLIKNLKSEKINLPNHFTLQRNGGIKTIISFNKKKIALISSSEKNCFFASLFLIDDKKELFRTNCLPEEAKNNDFNGLGSSNIHLKDKILFALGTPEKHASKNSLLAQLDNSKFGKILEIKKDNLISAIDSEDELKIDIFSKGHRVPQGLTILGNKIFNVEHGPKGGDELNNVIKGKNYGWAEVSYGTNYLKDNGGDGSSFKINHEKNNFEEPLFAFVPSVGISNLNNCPKVLKQYYKKNCLLALSLYGNNLRKGHSIIIFLLNEDLNKVVSVEKIQLGNLILRHFVTNDENVLYEDKYGNIYVSADKKGIYRISFKNLR